MFNRNDDYPLYVWSLFELYTFNDINDLVSLWCLPQEEDDLTQDDVYEPLDDIQE